MPIYIVVPPYMRNLICEAQVKSFFFIFFIFYFNVGASYSMDGELSSFTMTIVLLMSSLVGPTNTRP